MAVTNDELQKMSKEVRDMGVPDVPFTAMIGVREDGEWKGWWDQDNSEVVEESGDCTVYDDSDGLAEALCDMPRRYELVICELLAVRILPATHK